MVPRHERLRSAWSSDAGSLIELLRDTLDHPREGRFEGGGCGTLGLFEVLPSFSVVACGHLISRGTGPDYDERELMMFEICLTGMGS